MKKILAILVMLAALLASCESATQEELQNESEGFHEVEYQGYNYIMFMRSYGYAGYAGLTHNPDCPCKKGGKNE